ncbi:hypothetical protein [Hydrogenophaga sp.]|uniref:hypothetical protein n=1 Tax=Hydrogenophaga sp. TaxID=1904254 RepID=UPI003AF7E0E3
MTQIVSLAAARARPPNQSGDPTAFAYWSLADFSTDSTEDWLSAAIAGTPHEGMAISIWAHQPTLKKATSRLAEYITPRWPSQDGQSLLCKSIAEAVSRSTTAINNREAFIGRLVGVYLYGLTQYVADVARLSISGVDRNGDLQRWQHFAEPLKPWAEKHGIDTICAQLSHPGPTEVQVVGLHAHMVAHVADPIDTGYLIKHASKG